jgi:transposase
MKSSTKSLSADAIPVDQKIQSLLQEIANRDAVITKRDALIAHLQQQIQTLLRARFGRKAETLSHEQLELFQQAVDEDLGEVQTRLESLLEADKAPATKQPKRQPLPPELPREIIRHEPEQCTCKACGGELAFVRDEMSEQLEYVPARLIVKQYVRPQYSCRQCQSMVSAALPNRIIDKGIPGFGLLAHIAISKYHDHLPLERQSKILARSGMEIAPSTLAGWMGRVGLALKPLYAALHEDLLTQTGMHVDETPVTVLAPQGDKKTLRGYVWAYRSLESAAQQIAVYDLSEGRSGMHAQRMLSGFKGALVVDDYAGYKALFPDPKVAGLDAQDKCTELGCWAHVRRKFYDLHSANKSQQAETALKIIQKLYVIEKSTDPDRRYQARQEEAKPLLKDFKAWLEQRHRQIPKGTGLAKAIEYTLKRWSALIRYIENPAWPIDNNPVERSIRPLAVGRKNWLFAGSLSAGQRAMHIMSLIETAKLNGLEPWAYLRDVLEKLPTWPNSRLRELLPYHWTKEASS